MSEQSLDNLSTQQEICVEEIAAVVERKKYPNRFTSETASAAASERNSRPFDHENFVQLGKRQRIVLQYIIDHPGCCGQDIDRATNETRKAGGTYSHAITYDCINRLVKRGLIWTTRDAFRTRLEATAKAKQILAAKVAAPEPVNLVPPALRRDS